MQKRCRCINQDYESESRKETLHDDVEGKKEGVRPAWLGESLVASWFA